MGVLDNIKTWFSKSSKTNNASDPLESESYLSELDRMNSPDNSSKSNQQNDFIDKAKDFVSDSLDEAKEQGKELWSEIKEKVDILDESTKEFREKLADKAKAGLEKMDELIDETLIKAKDLDEKEKLKDADQDGIADKAIDFGKGLGDQQADFFNKAEKWLEHQKDHTRVENHKVIDSDSTQKPIMPVELPDDPETK